MKASNRYTLEHFDQDLRAVMWRVGVQGEQVCFIFDESNVLSPAFLERYVWYYAPGTRVGWFYRRWVLSGGSIIYANLFLFVLSSIPSLS